MNIDKMQAGREMDALVAEKVMKLQGFRKGTPRPDGTPYPWMEYIYLSQYGDNQGIPYYSTDIAAAWEVVEILGKHGYTAHIEWKGSNRVYAATAEVTFVKCIYTEGHGVGALPEAICRAAFKAVMGRD